MEGKKNAGDRALIGRETTPKERRSSRKFGKKKKREAPARSAALGLNQKKVYYTGRCFQGKNEKMGEGNQIVD